MNINKNNEYKKFVNNAIQIAGSIILKNPQIITSENTFLMQMGEPLHLIDGEWSAPSGVNVKSITKENWKYYRNMAGKRYIGETEIASDPIIKIRSLDIRGDFVCDKKNKRVTDKHGNYIFNRGGEIGLTDETKQYYPSTINQLKQRGTAYKTLLDTYPNHTNLINGILFPINKYVAMDAEDYTILYHDETLVEFNEYNLIPLLQKWIYNFIWRWNNVKYNTADLLYPAAFLSILYTGIVTEIINIRLSNCRTAYAHSFHVSAYLSGYYELNKYLDQIPHNVIMYLYRNIDYISTQGCNNTTLDDVYQNIIKPLGFDIKTYDVQKTKWHTNVVTINEHVRSTKIDTTIGIDTLVNKTEKLANLNPLINPLVIKTLQHLHRSTNKTRIPTNVHMLFKSDISSIHLYDKVTEIILGWFNLTLTDKISFDIDIILPDGESIIFTPTMGIIFYAYCCEKIYSTDHTRPRYIPTIPIRSYRSVNVDNSISMFKPYINWLRPVITACDDITAVNTNIQTLATVDILHMVLLETFESESDRVIYNQLFDKLISVQEYSHLSNTTYYDYFNKLGIDLTLYQNDVLRILVNDVLKGFLGDSGLDILNNIKETNILKILRTISSYTIQFTNIEDDDRYIQFYNYGVRRIGMLITLNLLPLNLLYDVSFHIPLVFGDMVYLAYDLTNTCKLHFADKLSVDDHSLFTITHHFNDILNINVDNTFTIG
jgi:hypothetical protein